MARMVGRAAGVVALCGLETGRAGPTTAYLTPGAINDQVSPSPDRCAKVQRATPPRCIPGLADAVVRARVVGGVLDHRVEHVEIVIEAGLWML